MFFDGDRYFGKLYQIEVKGAYGESIYFTKRLKNWGRSFDMATFNPKYKLAITFDDVSINRSSMSQIEITSLNKEGLATSGSNCKLKETIKI